MIVHYRAVRWWGTKADIEKEELSALYQELHKRYAPQVLSAILRLRGFYIKFGQVVSVLDFVPEAYRKELAVLQSGVPPKPPDEVRRLIAESLGKPITDIFAELDESVIGAASIGQVHRAKLLDGKRVVVKVQYPEVRALFASDFAQLVSACSFWSPQAMGDLRECRAQFMAEFDFEREARIMARIANNLARPFPSVAVPRPVADLVSEHVIVMSELPGTSLLDGLKQMAQAYADAQDITVDELKARMRARASADADGGVDGEVEGGLAPAMPSRLKLNLMHAYLRTSHLGVALYNKSIGRFTSPMKTSSAALPPMIDVSAMIKQLCAVLGHQVLVDGLFSSDPHPGNVMLLPDGRLGLIDFGQAKQLDDEQRRAVAHTVLAVASSDREAILRLVRATKFRTRRNDPDALVRYTKLMWEGSLKELGKLSKLDPIEQTDGEMVMVRRAVILVRSLGAAMGASVNMAKEWEELARRVVAETEAAGGARGSLLTTSTEVDAALEAAAALGVNVELLRDGGGGAKGVRVSLQRFSAALVWHDEHQHLVWRNTIRGGTLGPVAKACGEAALIRIACCAGRAAGAMQPERGFRLQQSPSSADEDDRLQTMRALYYLAWGHASGAVSESAVPARHYVISAGLKKLKLAGPWTDMAKQLSQSTAIAEEVRKYFPRLYFEQLERDQPHDLAPQMNHLNDAIAKLLEAPAAEDAAADGASRELLAALFGDAIQLGTLESSEERHDAASSVAAATHAHARAVEGQGLVKSVEDDKGGERCAAPGTSERHAATGLEHAKLRALLDTESRATAACKCPAAADHNSSALCKANSTVGGAPAVGGVSAASAAGGFRAKDASQTRLAAACNSELTDTEEADFQSAEEGSIDSDEDALR
uniref:ABC1 atypical kinase-like domain-containing protein n=1 Tax=Calcidiscus leptoporus TaxID=127549 RepID=A0A7S0NVB0_9EUKA